MFDSAVVKKQVISLLNLSVRDTTTAIPVYSTAISDTGWATEELDRAIQSAMTTLMRAICETEGHSLRGSFTTATSLTHAAQLPAHYGPIGVPRITPFSGASFTITGKRKSVEEIASYRQNPNYRYSQYGHNEADGSGNQSKLAGFYAIDGETVYFTGYSAVSDLATFVEADFTKLPDTLYPAAIALAISNLEKDGAMDSEIFGTYRQVGMAEIAAITGAKQAQPSLQKTIGAKDVGK